VGDRPELSPLGASPSSGVDRRPSINREPGTGTVALIFFRLSHAERRALQNKGTATHLKLPHTKPPTPHYPILHSSTKAIAPTASTLMRPDYNHTLSPAHPKTPVSLHRRGWGLGANQPGWVIVGVIVGQGRDPCLAGWIRIWPRPIVRAARLPRPRVGGPAGEVDVHRCRWPAPTSAAGPAGCGSAAYSPRSSEPPFLFLPLLGRTRRTSRCALQQGRRAAGAVVQSG